MVKKVKNTDSVAHAWTGQTIEPNEYYIIENVELFKWQNDSDVLTDIGSGILVVNDGTNDITDVATAINFLKDADTIPRDSDGSPLSRTKITTTGWHYQLHGVEFETSKLDSIYSKKVDGTDYGYSSIKFYKSLDGVDTQITGEDLNQEYLDTNCIKTILDWEPTHDLEIIGGMLKMNSSPSENLRMWTIGVPDIPEVYGGSKPFATNINLKYIGIEEGVKVDGRAPKYLTYSATYHTTKLRLIFRHSAGFKHDLHMIFELFKA